MLNDNHTSLRPLRKLTKILRLKEVEREKNKKMPKKRCIGLQLGVGITAAIKNIRALNTTSPVRVIKRL